MGTQEAQSDDAKESKHFSFDPNGICAMNGEVHRSPDQARKALDSYHADSWKKRIDEAFAYRKHTIRDIRSYFWGMDDSEEEPIEPLVAHSHKPSLACLFVSDLYVGIDKPSFPMTQLPKFMHDVGKGVPYDTAYGLLVPMHLHVNLGEARLLLRDYPLPLLHIPPIKPGQSPRLPSLSLQTDLVVGEEFRDKESQRHVNVIVIPDSKLGPEDHSKRFAVDVRRTISPVKTYSSMTFEINTAAPTRITWGTSYQPAIQDMMQRIEGFTKPAIDPSDRVGFWDKIRLSFHSRINVSWKGDGDVHLNLKGSRDPYVVTGFGAGLVMVWRNNVVWQINQSDDPKRFMIVESGDYILAIPDFLDYARQTMRLADPSEPKTETKVKTSFKKVAMKLSGNVQWLGGLVFEHDTNDDKRGFDFAPHYDVVLKHPDYARPSNGEPYDAFRGFRSHHIHMSLAVAAPQCRDWNVLNIQPSNNYNSVHLSPRFFTHFLDWWSLFSGAMSLPVRQGPLWSVQEKSSKKFGRHIATIKYNLLLSPVFLAHVYRHKGADSHASSTSSATGLKMKLDSLILDLHQRREYLTLPEEQNTYPGRNTSMRINQCQLNFISGDIRAISAYFHGRASREGAETSRFEIPDDDHAWIDMDDFIDVHCAMGKVSEAKILPLASAPGFTYYRQTDHGDDKTSSSPFGSEDTHYCIMSNQKDPRHVQSEILQQRLDKVLEQMTQNERITGEQELKVIRDHTNDDDVAKRYRATQEFGHVLHKKKEFLTRMIAQLNGEPGSGGPQYFHSHPTEEFVDHSTDFNNRFVVHNAQIKWNNALRNIILRYIHQVSQRRGFVYYMSRKAVKFILDIIDEKQKQQPSTNAPDAQSPGVEDYETIQDRIEQILADGRAFVEADDSARSSPPNDQKTSTNDDISTEFTAQNTYHFKLIAPQFQLQSDKNPKSVVLIASRSMQLKVVQIMDNDRIMDEVSGLVQRRFNATVDCLQVFVTSSRTFPTEYLHMYSGNRYGTTAGSYWPPWVPVEVMYEFEVNPYGFSRVVQPTSASLRYDKFNSLRLKYNDGVGRGGGHEPDSPESRMDHLWIDFPEVRAICDSLQYFAMYIIVVDLLLYSEPLEKTRSERLEKIMLASDFSDLTGVPEMVETLQARINQLDEIKIRCMAPDGPDPSESSPDGHVIDRDLNSFEDELFFMMEAITTSQRRIEDRVVQDSSTGIVRRLVSARRIVWHLVKEEHESLLEFQLKDCTFDRTDNNDGSNANSIEIGLINGYNLLANALYPQIIGPYSDEADPNVKMLRVHWLMLEAIAGIPVVDYFEVDLVPVKVQLEREIAKQIFEYIFPGVGEHAFEGNGFSPFQIKQLLPARQGDKDDAEENIKEGEPIYRDREADDVREQGPGTGAGTLEQRLVPTLNLKDPIKRNDRKDGHAATETGGHWYNFSSRDRSRTQLQRKSGLDTPTDLRSTPSEQSLVGSTGPSSIDASVSKGKSSWQGGRDKDRRKDEKEKQSDDLTQMVDRASNYMTLSVFKVHSLVLSLSYKGRGNRNLEDVHDLVFRMPALEYRNKTWSNLDLALQVKKDVVRALISHTGAIIGNKFGHHRPSKQQQLRIREMANSQLMMSVTRDLPDNNFDDPTSARTSLLGSASSDTSSMFSHTESRNRSMLSPSGQSTASPAKSLRRSTDDTRSPATDRSSQNRGPISSDTSRGPESPRGGRLEHADSPSEDSKTKGSVSDLGEVVNKRLTGLGRRLRGISDATTNTNGDEAQDSDGSRKKSRLVSGSQKLLKRAT